MDNRKIPLDPSGIQVGPAAVTMKTLSMFAAITWSVPSIPEAPHVNMVFRGRMSTIVDAPGRLCSMT
jgi:hypothetical protein